MRSFKTVCFGLLVTFLAVKSEPIFADRIEDCPPLPSRPAPTSITDLRPDDIKVVGALGDSILAGATSLGLEGKSIFSINPFLEARGIPYGSGGDPGAVTIPNFFKKYSPDVKGASLSQHILEYCVNGLCDASQFVPELDQLNGAQSGATSHNLPIEIEYIANTMKTIPGIDYEKDWKFLTIQIGGLDQCMACYPDMQEASNPDFYAKNVENVLEYVRDNIPRTVVNLIGVFNVSTVYPITRYNPYCKASIFGKFQTNMMECYCAMNTANIASLNSLATAYSEKLRALHLKYKAQQTDSFGVIYTPANVNFTSFPIDFFSDVDCYHPSIKGHSYLARMFWRPLFMPLHKKPSLLEPKDGEKVYCPKPHDRLVI